MNVAFPPLSAFAQARCRSTYWHGSNVLGSKAAQSDVERAPRVSILGPNVRPRASIGLTREARLGVVRNFVDED
jgi:hypothetical protein